MFDKRLMEDKSMKIRVYNKSDVPLHGIPVDGSIVTDADKDGTPLRRDLRRRLADSKIDGCIEIEPIKKIKPVKTEDKK